MCNKLLKLSPLTNANSKAYTSYMSRMYITLAHSFFSSLIKNGIYCNHHGPNSWAPQLGHQGFG